MKDTYIASCIPPSPIKFMKITLLLQLAYISGTVTSLVNRRYRHRSCIHLAYICFSVAVLVIFNTVETLKHLCLFEAMSL